MRGPHSSSQRQCASRNARQLLEETVLLKRSGHLSATARFIPRAMSTCWGSSARPPGRGGGISGEEAVRFDAIGFSLDYFWPNTIPPMGDVVTLLRPSHIPVPALQPPSRYDIGERSCRITAQAPFFKGIRQMYGVPRAWRGLLLGRARSGSQISVQTQERRLASA